MDNKKVQGHRLHIPPFEFTKRGRAQRIAPDAATAIHSAGYASLTRPTQIHSIPLAIPALNICIQSNTL